MKDSQGNWLATPPSYPCIQIPGMLVTLLKYSPQFEGVKTNLFSDFVDMSNTRIGTVMNQEQFIKFFASVELA
jgi:hypothetical protein